jgi:DNA-binding response OmpR family regulator
MLEAATRTGFCPSCGFNLTKDEPIERDGFVIDPRGVVTFEGRQVPFTKAEHNLLHTLARAEGRCVESAVLGERLGESEDPVNTARVLILRIRRRCWNAGAPNPIRTVWGRGYRWGLT